jgi:hypothetical protein
MQRTAPHTGEVAFVAERNGLLLGEVALLSGEVVLLCGEVRLLCERNGFLWLGTVRFLLPDILVTAFQRLLLGPNGAL